VEVVSPEKSTDMSGSLQDFWVNASMDMFQNGTGPRQEVLEASCRGWSPQWLMTSRSRHVRHTQTRVQQKKFLDCYGTICGDNSVKRLGYRPSLLVDEHEKVGKLEIISYKNAIRTLDRPSCEQQMKISTALEILTAKRKLE